MNKVLITGSNGLIGSAAVSFFSPKADLIIGLDNNFRKHFFGNDGKISHVGISTGGYNLIHCQGWVKEESFDYVDYANKKLADMYMHTCSVELNSAQ